MREEEIRIYSEGGVASSSAAADGEGRLLLAGVQSLTSHQLDNPN